MKIKITFPPDLNSVTPGTIALLPGGTYDPGVLARRSRELEAALITPPYRSDRQLGMLCAVDGRYYFQSKCFLSEEEKHLYTPGTDVEKIPTPWGPIAMCCGEDIFQPMYARTAALKGCCLLAVSMDTFEEDLLISGPWSACQANCMPVAMRDPSRSRLILPCTMTADHSGFGKEEFDTAALRAAYEEFPIFRSMNKAFYRRYREVLL